MNRNLKKALLSLALAALLLPTIGCDYNLDRHGSSGDWTSGWFDFVITPAYGGWSAWDTYSYDEVYVQALAFYHDPGLPQLRSFPHSGQSPHPR